MREKNRSLFDLLLDETYPWETLTEEHQETRHRRSWHDSSSKPLEAASRRERVMNDASKVKPSHIQRAAFVYIRQSVLRRSSTTANPQLANMLWSRKPASWVGPKNK